MVMMSLLLLLLSTPLCLFYLLFIAVFDSKEHFRHSVANIRCKILAVEAEERVKGRGGVKRREGRRTRGSDDRPKTKRFCAGCI